MVFFNDKKGISSTDRIVAVPEERIIQIFQSGVAIHIFFEDGTDIFDDGNHINGYQRISESVVLFESEESAIENMRGFYRACQKGDGGFFFG